MRRINTQLFYLLILGAWSLAATLAHGRSIDRFDYASTSQAREQWQARGDSPAVTVERTGGVTFTLPFDRDLDRVYWDRQVQLNLSTFDTFALELTAPAPEHMRSLAIYFQSGDGWYIWSRPLHQAGRQTITLMKSAFETEGNPTGWHRIERIRISPWRGSPGRSHLTFHRLEAQRPTILLLRADQLPAGERNVARRSTQRISQWLSDVDLPHAVIPQQELNPGRLHHSRIVILPYNPTLSSAQRDQLRSFIRNGGKLMVFYSSDAELARMMGFRLGDYKAAEGPDRWSAIHFADAHRLRVPARVYQSSWNIRPVYPAQRSAQVIASWDNAVGQPTGHPAWTQSSAGVWMSHILLQGDDENKRSMLASLLAELSPPLWSELAVHARRSAGRVGPHTTLQDATAQLSRARVSATDRAAIRTLLAHAAEQQRRLDLLYERGRYPETVDVARGLRRNLVEAYALSQSSQANEWRAVWDHSGTGLYPGAWDRTAKLLADHGVNAILANVLWGGVAHFDSRVVPSSMTYRLYGDQLAQAVEAGQRHGVEVHAWIVCWNLTGAPADFVERMRNQGRLIQDADGNEMPWLNPGHPDNIRLMVDSLLDLASRYDVDGIHLDYIRYPHRRACFSSYSRQRFEQWLGRRVANWPADALPGGRDDQAFRRFRVDQINLSVRTVHQELRQAHPQLKISAAVWGGYPDVINSIGQDWAAWLESGQVDFVTPMNYTVNPTEFAQLTRRQMELPGARGRVFPGLGVTAAESQLRPDQVIQQIRLAREAGATGWVLFDLNNTLRAETLPTLRKGITRP